MSTQAESVRSAKHVSFDRIVFAAWIVTVAAVSVRIAFGSSQNDLVATYADAGARWLRSLPLYSTTSGFIHSPLVAGLFAPLSLVPHSVAGILWRLLNVGVFAGAIFWWLKSEIHDLVKKKAFLRGLFATATAGDYRILSKSRSFSSAIGTRSCFMLSRSRNVTVSRFSGPFSPIVSKSMVTPKGVPASSCRR